MSKIISLIRDIAKTVLNYLKADWYILLFGILLAVFIKVYIGEKGFQKYLAKNSKVSIISSIGFGAFTPLCACGTMAVLLSMFITSMPWGPVMAFLVSSPLTSPSEFVFQTSFFGIQFAVAVLLSSVVLGLFAGFLADFLHKEKNFFEDEFRFMEEKNDVNTSNNNGCCLEESNSIIECCSSPCCSKSKSLFESFKVKEFFQEFVNLGLKKVLFYFIIFIAIGRIAEIIIPSEWIMSLFSSDKIYSIPLGATIGLPLYVSGPAALPLMKSFMNSGAGKGVLLAFLITGKATGVPVIAGLSVLLKKKALIFYVAIVYFGGIALGLVYQMLLNIGL